MIKKMLFFTLAMCATCFTIQAQTQAEIDGTSQENIYFDHDSSALTDGARQVLQEIVNDADLNGNLRLKLTGMTNSIGSVEYNYKLAERRVQAVKAYIESKGGKIEDYKVFGPLATSDSCCICDVNENRKVEIEITDVQILSGVGYDF